jgi:hypothetical protein
MSRKVFTAGEVLAAADVNSFLMDQTVMSFAGTAARGSAIPSPVEGMVSYLEDTNVMSLYDGSAWRTSLSPTGGILQVVSTTKTDTFSTSTTTTYVDVTGLSLTITPKASSSKIMILGSIFGATDSTLNFGRLRLMRDSTAIAIGNADSARSQLTAGFGSTDTVVAETMSVLFLDSPATTSAVTYKFQVSSDRATSSSTFINRNSYTPDNTIGVRAVSTITAFEVSA